MKISIGEKIALLRKSRNITQTDLAEYLFLAPQTVSRWEVGSGAPDIALLPKIATFFGVSIDELFGLTSLERTEDLVAKYSVLRDDRSFHEAMEYIDSQLQSIEAFIKSGAEDELHLLMCLLKVYDGGQLAALKQRLCSLLPKAGLNQYFEEKAREKINLA